MDDGELHEGVGDVGVTVGSCKTLLVSSRLGSEFQVHSLEGAPCVAHLRYRTRSHQLRTVLGRGPISDAPGVSDTGLAQEGLVHIDLGLHAVLLEELDLADLLEDEGLARLIALDFQSSRVVASVLHALETIEDRVEDVATILAGRSLVSSRPGVGGWRGTYTFAEEGRVGENSTPA